MSRLKELGITGIIDGHTHSGGTDYYNQFEGNIPHTQAVEDLLLKAALAGVESVVTMPFPTTSYYNPRVLTQEHKKLPSGFQNFPYQVENLSLLRTCAFAGPRILPFVCVDPKEKTQEQLDSLGRLMEQYRIYGLKLHTLATGSTAEDLHRSGFVDFALEKNLPFLIHSDLRSAPLHPINVARFAKQRPKLRVCIAHLAWLDQEAIDAVATIENLFIDCSPFLYIFKAAREKTRMVARQNMIIDDDPAGSLLNYARILKDSLIWGTDEPWTRSIDVDGTVDSDHTYTDEANLLAQIFERDAEMADSLAQRNARVFLFGRA